MSDDDGALRSSREEPIARATRPEQAARFELLLSTSSTTPSGEDRAAQSKSRRARARHALRRETAPCKSPQRSRPSRRPESVLSPRSRDKKTRAAHNRQKDTERGSAGLQRVVEVCQRSRATGTKDFADLKARAVVAVPQISSAQTPALFSDEKARSVESPARKSAPRLTNASR